MQANIGESQVHKQQWKGWAANVPTPAQSQHTYTNTQHITIQ